MLLTAEGPSPHKVLGNPWGGTEPPDRDKNPLALPLGDWSTEPPHKKQGPELRSTKRKRTVIS